MGDCMGCIQRDERIRVLERDLALVTTDYDVLNEKTKQAFRSEQAAKNQLAKQRATDHDAADVQRVIDHWRMFCNHAKAKAPPASDRWEATRKMLAHFSVAELKQAVNGAARFPYVVNAKRSEAGHKKQRYDDLTLICRDVRNVERFMEMALDDAGQPVDIAPHEPVVNAKLFEEAINEAAHLRHLLEVQRDMIELEAHVNEGLLREIAEMRAEVAA